jgi:hypothetical protein
MLLYSAYTSFLHVLIPPFIWCKEEEHFAATSALRFPYTPHLLETIRPALLSWYVLGSIELIGLLLKKVFWFTPFCSIQLAWSCIHAAQCTHFCWTTNSRGPVPVLGAKQFALIETELHRQLSSVCLTVVSWWFSRWCSFAPPPPHTSDLAKQGTAQWANFWHVCLRVSRVHISKERENGQKSRASRAHLSKNGKPGLKNLRREI